MNSERHPYRMPFKSSTYSIDVPEALSIDEEMLEMHKSIPYAWGHLPTRSVTTY